MDSMIQEPEPSLELERVSGVTMFERLATDPSVDVAKLEKLIEMHERILRHQAKAAFDAAFSEMQGDLPTITEDGEIEVDGVVRSTFATDEAIVEAVRPVLKRYGFALRFKNKVADGKLKIIGILSHKGGHSEDDEFETDPDDSGKKNKIQARGSARSYGKRYTTIALLNIVTRGQDDDGQSAYKPDETEVPAGLEDWWMDLRAVADEGFEAFAKTWNESRKDYRTFVTKHRNGAVTTLKKHAATKKAAQA